MRKQNLFRSMFILCLSVLFLVSGLEAGKPTPGTGKTLTVTKVTQEHSNWCWDGSSLCVLLFKGKSTTQCAIANFAWNRSDCCGSNVFYWNHVCNQGNYLFGHQGDIQDVLTNWGVSSSGVNGSLA